MSGFSHLKPFCGSEKTADENLEACLIVTDKMALEANEVADAIILSETVPCDTSGLKACLRALKEKSQLIRQLFDQYRSKKQRRKSLKNFTTELHEVNQWLHQIGVLGNEESMGGTVQHVRVFIDNVKETLRGVQRKSQEIEGRPLLHLNWIG